MLISARKWLLVAVLLFVLVFLVSSVVKPGFALADSVEGGVTKWNEDPIVTEVGKSAARSRQLLYWTMSHPAINRAQVISSMWAFTRNIVYVFFVIVIAVGGIGIVVSRRQGSTGPIFSGISSPFAGLNPGTLIMRIAALLVYATFSYVFVLGLIEFAQILQNFFIERLEGCRLFNINFGSATQCLPDSLAEYQEAVRGMEKNYMNFVGYRDFDPRKQEMVATSLFYIRLTTMTYNMMSYIMILRDVVLWFLMVVAPILALLMPFTFIRNVGWIWIGVFLQWLFYGPLFTLFIGSVVKIWDQGIPYGFDFSRVPVNNSIPDDVAQALPFKTSINILWGGPAQTLDVYNSANYIDTFAEYIVSLVMLWVAIMLPWLLLRIFRDYCCDILKQNQGTLKAIYGQLRSGVRSPNNPPSPAGEIVTPAGIATALPFRKVQNEQRRVNESIKRSISVEKLNNIKKIETSELSKSLNITVKKLQDLARIETNESYKKNVREQLDKIANPVSAVTDQEKQQFSQVRNELVQRANQGDVTAARILQSASKPGIDEFVTSTSVMSTERLVSIAKEVGTTEQQMQRIAGILPTISNLSHDEQVSRIVKSSELTHSQVQNVINNISQVRSSLSPAQIAQISQSTQTSNEQVQNVANIVSSTSALTRAEQVKKVSEEMSLSEEKSQEIAQLVSESQVSLTQTDFERISKETGVTAEQVEKISTMLPQVQMRAQGTQQQDQIDNIIEQTRVTKEQAEKVLSSLSQERGRVELARIPHELPAAVSVSQIKKAAEVSKTTENQVAQVVRTMPTIGTLSPAKQIEQIAREADITPLQAAQIVDTLVESKPVEIEGEEQVSRVSVDDYEEVKSMWLNHYRNSSIPLSGKIKTRADWINQDTVRITNALNLLQSNKPEMKEEGLSEVEKILPFLLLGGFGNEEAVVYMKAKLEAAKAVMSEVKSEAQKAKEVGTEDEKVFVEVGEVQEELAKAMKQERKLEAILPKGERAPIRASASVPTSANTTLPTASPVNLEPVLQKLDLTLRKLQDIAQLETDLSKRQEVEDTLDKLNIPLVKKDFDQIKTQSPKIVGDDLEDVKNLWIRYYREAPVPQDQGFVSRLEWVKHDFANLESLGQMLHMGTQEQYDLVMDNYGQYLQFVMLGEFSLDDIVRYIDVRFAAAEFVVKELELAGNEGNPQGSGQEFVDRAEPTQLDDKLDKDQQVAEIKTPKE